jgi:hypothetical protein
MIPLTNAPSQRISQHYERERVRAAERGEEGRDTKWSLLPKDEDGLRRERERERGVGLVVKETVVKETVVKGRSVEKWFVGCQGDGGLSEEGEGGGTGIGGVDELTRCQGNLPPLEVRNTPTLSLSLSLSLFLILFQPILDFGPPY